MSNVFRGPSKDASYQVSIYLAKWFQRRRFLEVNQSETRIACGGNVFTNLDEMSNLYRGPSNDASYQVSIHFSKRFREKDFLEINQSETRMACGNTCQTAPYQDAPTFTKTPPLFTKMPPLFFSE
jgi:hypothetical protein